MITDQLKQHAEETLVPWPHITPIPTHSWFKRASTPLLERKSHRECFQIQQFLALFPEIISNKFLRPMGSLSRRVLHDYEVPLQSAVLTSGLAASASFFSVLHPLGHLCGKWHLCRPPCKAQASSPRPRPHAPPASELGQPPWISGSLIPNEWGI